MSFDRESLARAIAAHGPVARVLVLKAQGSTPREAGTAMLVWADGRDGGGQEGTIGGGTLEWEATAMARARLAEAAPGPARATLPLGPALGQCCGGSVTLAIEVFATGAALPAPGPAFARPVAPGAPAEPPLAVTRLLARARNGSAALAAPVLREGWLVEPMTAPRAPLWLWGAGHVGRAIAATMAPLDGFAITWIDTAASRFPEAIPEGIVPRVAEDPAALVPEAPPGAHHLVLTYSHALDLALCHALLSHGFASAGLIGSATKWARFRSRLAALGHPPAAIARITCPIGDPSLGKAPQAIAISTAAQLLAALQRPPARKDMTG